MTFIPGFRGGQRDPELLRQDAAAKLQRLEDEAATRKELHEARSSRPGVLRRLLRRRAK